MSAPRRVARIVQSIAAPLVVMALIALVLAVQIGRLHARALLVDRSDQMLAKAHEAQNCVTMQEAALRGYALTGDARFRQRYDATSADGSLAELDALVVDGEQRARVVTLRTRYDAWKAEPTIVPARLNDRQTRLDELDAEFTLFVRHETELRAHRAADSRAELRHTITWSAVLFLVCVYLLAFFSRSQVKRVAAGYERALEDRRRNEEVRDVFLGILGHDLQNPLSAVIVSAGMAARRPGIDEIQKKALGRVLSASDRMRRMIAQLLDMTRARVGGGLRVERRPASFSAMCQRVIDEARAANPSREIDAVVDGDLTCLFDDDRMAQVLSNLLGNAITHGAPDRPIVVAARRCHADSIELLVHNEGKAIEPALLDAIFDPFRRGGDATRRGSKGLGLGLFIAKQILLAHGGDLSVTSREESGTTFRAQFPAVPVTTMKLARDDSTPALPGPAAHGGAHG